MKRGEKEGEEEEKEEDSLKEISLIPPPLIFLRRKSIPLRGRWVAPSVVVRRLLLNAAPPLP